MTNMADFWPEATQLSNDRLFDIPTFTVKIVDGAGTQDPETKRWTKIRVPSCSSGSAETSSNSTWVVTLEIVSSHNLGQVSSCVKFSDRDEQINVPIQCLGTTPSPNDSLVNGRKFTVRLDSIINGSYASKGGIFTLKLLVDNLYDDVEFEIKDFQMTIQVQSEDYTPGTIGTKEKTQVATCTSKKRLQRLDKKFLDFLLCTNVQINDDEPVRGFVKRIDNAVMIGNEKAVTGETEVPVHLQKYTKSRMVSDDNHCYYFQTDLDPTEFYVENPGKELYTSDKSSPDNNIFMFNVCVPVDDRVKKQEVYRFRTRSKDHSGITKLVRAVMVEADRGRIKELSIEKLTTVKGDIAYTWSLMNPDTAGRYEEGDVVGLFPNPSHPNDKTFIDLLTPCNYKDAIVAGVITRSYYLDANSQEDGEKLCMVGMVKIKVSGTVKHGDFIYVSGKIPGIAVTQDQLTADKGNNWRNKRLLGRSLETNTQPDVKLVNCIVSVLLCINNDQVQELLSEMESSLSKDVEDRIDSLCDDVDLKIGCMKEIVATTHDQVASSRRASKAARRRKVCGCLTIVLMLLVAFVACYIFLCPTSFYNVWKCHRGALSGTLTFYLDSLDEEEHVIMKGKLYTWHSLKSRLDLKFDQKKNFTGSYYNNLRRCQGENLRKVLGWFSNPPVYLRAQVFAVDCNCTTVFHYHMYHSWKNYKLISPPPICTGQKGSRCEKKGT